MWPVVVLAAVATIFWLGCSQYAQPTPTPTDWEERNPQYAGLFWAMAEGLPEYVENHAEFAEARDGIAAYWEELRRRYIESLHNFEIEPWETWPFCKTAISSAILLVLLEFASSPGEAGFYQVLLADFGRQRATDLELAQEVKQTGFADGVPYRSSLGVDMCRDYEASFRQPSISTN